MGLFDQLQRVAGVSFGHRQASIVALARRGMLNEVMLKKVPLSRNIHGQYSGLPWGIQIAAKGRKRVHHLGWVPDELLAGGYGQNILFGAESKAAVFFRGKKGQYFGMRYQLPREAEFTGGASTTDMSYPLGLGLGAAVAGTLLFSFLNKGEPSDESTSLSNSLGKAHMGSGFPEYGISSLQRKVLTDFGSGFNPTKAMARKVGSEPIPQDQDDGFNYTKWGLTAAALFPTLAVGLATLPLKYAQTAKRLITGRQTFYHGTAREYASAIKQQGLLTSQGGKRQSITNALMSGELSEAQKKLVYLTPSRIGATGYSGQAELLKGGSSPIYDPLTFMFAGPIEGLKNIRKGVVKFDIPTWKKEFITAKVKNPELGGATNLLGFMQVAHNRMLRNKPMFAPTPPALLEAYATASAYPGIKGASVYARNIGTKYIVGTPEFQKLTTKEWKQYAKLFPERIVAGGALAAAPVAAGAYIATPKIMTALEKNPQINFSKALWPREQNIIMGDVALENFRDKAKIIPQPMPVPKSQSPDWRPETNINYMALDNLKATAQELKQAYKSDISGLTNRLEGLPEGGISTIMRQTGTDFSSPWQGPIVSEPMAQGMMAPTISADVAGEGMKASAMMMEGGFMPSPEFQHLAQDMPGVAKNLISKGTSTTYMRDNVPLSSKIKIKGTSNNAGDTRNLANVVSLNIPKSKVNINVQDHRTKLTPQVISDMIER